MFECIVAGVSRAETAKSVGRQAVELANDLGSEIHLVACYDSDESSGGRPVDRHLQSMLEGLALQATGTVETHVRAGNPATEVLEVARHRGADLIVVGNKGVKGARRVLGSVAKTVSQQSDCAVLILASS
jgi:nucleotide-binding universal stress UspA family protein